jgi:nitroreductase/NAD-dependent dihydropyrimidine dehydrogenase PreA subunit
MITLNPSKCTRCYRCVKACPSGIFIINDDQSIKIENEDLCIKCGHCVAACGFNALTHDFFPPEKIHAIDVSQLPTPEQVLLLIRKRRSNRAFSTKAIPEEYLSQILEAAYRAPTASNMQQVQFTLVTNPEKVNLITRFTLNVFTSIIKMVDNALLRPVFNLLLPNMNKYFPMFKKMQQTFDEHGKDIGILRGATAVLFFHTPKNSRFGSDDCQLAYQNASLMAESLGVSQFYTGFVLQATKQKKQKLEKLLGINGIIHAGMALGMPQFQYPNYIDRNEIVLNRL